MSSRPPVQPLVQRLWVESACLTMAPHYGAMVVGTSHTCPSKRRRSSSICTRRAQSSLHSGECPDDCSHNDSASATLTRDWHSLTSVRSASSKTFRQGAPAAAFTDTMDSPAPDIPLPDWKSVETRRAYYAAVSFMDSQVGKLLNGLDQVGRAENTAVVFQ